jgi:hypothetical protein
MAESDRTATREPAAYGRNWAYAPCGMPVWALILYLGSYDWDIDRTVTELGDPVTRDDVVFAKEYYDSHRAEIDRKLDEIENA